MAALICVCVCVCMCVYVCGCVCGVVCVYVITGGIFLPLLIIFFLRRDIYTDMTETTSRRPQTVAQFMT